MVFSIPNFEKDEEKNWNKADDAGKLLFLEQWFQEMLGEGSKYYDSFTTVHYLVNLTKKKMEIVKAEAFNLGLTIKDPFEEHYDDEDNEDNIGMAHDAKKVVIWADKNPGKVQKLYTKVPGSYFFSKFRFFRRIHFWMEKTVEKIGEYKQAKEKAKLCNYWDHAEHFSFEDYIDEPSNFTEEQFLSHQEIDRHLHNVDRMQSSDQEDQEEYPSSSEGGED